MSLCTTEYFDAPAPGHYALHTGLYNSACRYAAYDHAPNIRVTACCCKCSVCNMKQFKSTCPTSQTGFSSSAGLRAYPAQFLLLTLMAMPRLTVLESVGMNLTLMDVSRRGAILLQFDMNLGPFRWICENFDGPQHPSLRYSSSQDRQQADKLIQSCSGLVDAGLDLLAGRTSRYNVPHGLPTTAASWHATLVW